MATRKSRAVPATLLAATALIVSGCGSPNQQVRRCVDERGNVMPESACERRRPMAGFYGYPRHVYGGSVVGNQVRNFSAAPQSGARIVTPNGRVISRGGFGGSGRGFSGLG